jgi:hypothetical protein
MIKGESMVALAIEVPEQDKWAAYEARVAKAPKRDRRNLSRASEQTKWIINATAEWYAHYVEASKALGLPTENILYRAGLMIPRAPMGSSVPQMPEPSALAAAVEKAMRELSHRRREVVIACERFASFPMDRPARHLGMDAGEFCRELDGARQSLADMLRVTGWRVPHKV